MLASIRSFKPISGDVRKTEYALRGRSCKILRAWQASKVPAALVLASLGVRAFHEFELCSNITLGFGDVLACFRNLATSSEI